MFWSYDNSKLVLAEQNARIQMLEVEAKSVEELHHSASRRAASELRSKRKTEISPFTYIYKTRERNGPNMIA
jgi:hypothetical protein